MPIIKSISGIRGTLGEKSGEGLDPLLVVQYCLAYATWLKRSQPDGRINIVVGRDGRISGEVLENLVVATLRSAGVDVIQTGLSTTPTLEMAVVFAKADGGIILTASHNPANWNALKFFDAAGEFISPEVGTQLLAMVEGNDFDVAKEDELGTLVLDNSFMQQHVEAVLDMPVIDRKAIADAQFTVVADAINSTGGIILPMLFDALGVKYKILFGDCDGKFAHNPEPLPAHLTDLTLSVKEMKADMGISVDPDVDRLALVCENGELFGEEYTLVAAADYILTKTKGNTVSNLSSTQALRDVTIAHGGQYYGSAVGEVNVVAKMKETNAVIGGEGNGGVIYPALHYGRDAIAGIAMILSLMATRKKSLSQLRSGYPAYFISKNKVELKAGTDVDAVLRTIEAQVRSEAKGINTIDGLKVEYGHEWVHLRKSNTEPIIRIYSESRSETEADALAKKFVEMILRNT
ncbi:MAG: phosphoglucosamine mutase [Bacteroidetes bacterium HGW-Bacteroidetes-6]|jgi:phosphomannomutase|nr:MAG: phosphoglucosamine mutase [Bacteroidetes bacterium HGW-Bacteroidetes-6]